MKTSIQPLLPYLVVALFWVCGAIVSVAQGKSDGLGVALTATILAGLYMIAVHH